MTQIGSSRGDALRHESNTSETHSLWRMSILNVTEMVPEPGSGHFNTVALNQYNTTDLHRPITMADENNISVGDGFTRRYPTSTPDFVEGEVHAMEYRIGLGCLVCVAVVIAITGNFLVLLAITKTRSLRRLNNFLLVSLAVSDFLSAVICMPLFITELFNDYTWILPNTLCSFYTSLQLSFLFLSTWNIAAISLERVFIIMYPMIYQRAVTESRMLVFIIGLWVLSIAYGMSQLHWFNSEPHLSWSRQRPEFCRYLPSMEYAIIDFVICFTLPLCVMFGAYLKIYYIVQSQMSRIHPRFWEDGPSEFSTNNFEKYISEIYKENKESPFSTTNQRDFTSSDSVERYQRRDENYEFVAQTLRKISIGFADVNSLFVEQISQPGSESHTPTPEDPAKSAAEAWNDNVDSENQINKSSLNITELEDDELRRDNFNVKQSNINNGLHDSKEATINSKSSNHDNNDNISNSGDNKILENSCITRIECETDYPHRAADNQRSCDNLAQVINKSTVDENSDQIMDSSENVAGISSMDSAKKSSKNYVKLAVPEDLVSNLQLQVTDLEINPNLDMNSTQSTSSNPSFNRWIDPDQNDLNQSVNMGEVKCVEVETDQIHIQANQTGPVCPKSGTDQSEQLKREKVHPYQIEPRYPALPNSVTSNTAKNLTFRSGGKLMAKDEDDVFSISRNVEQIDSEMKAKLSTIIDHAKALRIPALKGSVIEDPKRPRSHESPRLAPRSSRCFGDSKPLSTVFDAGIEINISRTSSKDGFAFPLRRASSARPDLNSISPDIPTSSTSSGFGTKLHPVLKSSSKNGSTGNLFDHNGQTPGRKRNSVVFRLYDDEILPDDDPNTVQTIPKVRVPTGMEDTTTETSGIGTMETILTTDNSIMSNDASSKRNLRDREEDPSKAHTHQWAKKHFIVSRDQSSTSLSMRSRGGSGASSWRTSSITRRLRKNKAIRMTAAVIGAFVLCILPYKIVFLMRVRDISSVSDLGWNIVSSLMFFTNALNPFIYNFYNSSFRAAIKRLILCKGTPVGPV